MAVIELGHQTAKLKDFCYIKFGFSRSKIMYLMAAISIMYIIRVYIPRFSLKKNKV